MLTCTCFLERVKMTSYMHAYSGEKATVEEKVHKLFQFMLDKLHKEGFLKFPVKSEVRISLRGLNFDVAMRVNVEDGKE